MSASWCCMRKIYKDFSIKLFKSSIKHSPSFSNVIRLNYSTAYASKFRVLLKCYCTAAVEKTQVRFKEKKSTTKKTKETKETKRKIQYDSITYDIPTAAGAKKDTCCTLPKSYSPEYVEAAWYDWWVAEGFFTPEYSTSESQKSEREKFVICLPPPNVTGTLHLGHAITNSIQDAIVRWHRMRGYETLWIPGCDHAGIATQVVVEKNIWKQKKKTRHDLGRAEFIKEVWKWKQEKGETINDQMKRMGSSLDWSRSCFTMDEKLSEAVHEAFIRLHEEGIIYRSNRMVNWSCQLQSVISDIEVENVPLSEKTLLTIPGYDQKVEFGTLTSFAYPVADRDEEVVVSTTRPETMLGDTAVAVHPEDARYKHLHGNYVRHPIDGRLIPIVCDESVKTDFGTGAVKITPAHDKNDYELGKRHDLPSMSVIDKKGLMQNVGSQFIGVKRFDARKLVIEELKKQNLYRGTQSHGMVMPICSRSQDVIEPLVMDQWFVDCRELAQQAIEVVRKKELLFIPDYYTKSWFSWLQNTDSMDWCISRQLWWGHRIPAYLARDKNKESEEFWVSGRTFEEARMKAAKKLGVKEDDIVLQQDEDVLDTWFSSALFPFSSLGWPSKTHDLSQYYPSTVLETGSDIMFFWVARMVMMGLKLTNQLPFHKVILHGMLRDAHGRKMSKSLGNVIDPIDVITGISLQGLHDKVSTSNLAPQEVATAKEGQKIDFPDGIPTCGTDALRFTLCSYDFKDQEIPMNVKQVQANRHLCNKIWNGFKFVSANFDGQLRGELKINSCLHMDMWILSRLYNMVNICNQSFDTFELQLATKTLYSFWVTDFCDVYMEYSKQVLYSDDEKSKDSVKEVLLLCVDIFLRSLSPFMPYLTEELYQRLPGDKKEKSICVSKYPCIADVPYEHLEIEKQVNMLRIIATHVLSVASRYNIKNNNLPVFICVKDKSLEEGLNMPSLLNAFKVISRCKSVVITKEIPKESTIYHLETGVEVGITLKGIVDAKLEIQKSNEKLSKLEKKLDLQKKALLKITKSTPNQQKLQEKVLETEEFIERLKASICDLEKMGDEDTKLDHSN